MSRDIETTLEQLQEWLPYVARDAERYGDTTKLVEQSHEFHLAARAISETLPHPSLASGAPGPFLTIKIGASAVEAFSFRKLPYDMRSTEECTAEPGEQYRLMYRYNIGVDTYNLSLSQPVFGQRKYFDLATLGRTMIDGGELSLTTRNDSSSRK